MVTIRSRRRIHAWLITGLFVAMLISLASCASTSTTTTAPSSPPGGGSGPRLSIDKPVADFGKAVYDQMVQPVWTLTNTGTAPLQIRDFKLDVKEGCWPPQLTVGSTDLKPGQVLSLQPGESVKVTTQLAMHQGMGGPHDFRWTIVSNDSSQSEQVLTLKVEYPKP